MNKLKLLIGMCMLLLLVVGCDSSYNDCIINCYKVNSDMKVRECVGYLGTNLCMDKVSDDLNELCFNECKPK